MQTDIIPRIESECQIPQWQKLMSQGFTQVDELLEYLQLDARQVSAGVSAGAGFGLRVPRAFASLIEKGNPNDPILKQLLPSTAEENTASGFSHDPVGDLQREAAPGLLHKYHGRVLLIASAVCGIHCRYCFRRHYPYSDAAPVRNNWQPSIDYIAQHTDISEVILSGGDPLTLADQRLLPLLEALGDIPHLKRLRFHTRLPVILPERITSDLLDAIEHSPLQTLLVYHINHANEISSPLKTQVQRLKERGATLLNQSVLLKGVNNSVEDLCNLSEALFEAGILPYYLHLLDKVSGAAHFELEDKQAIALHRSIAARLPGYLVPRLVREISGAPAKQAVYCVAKN